MDDLSGQALKGYELRERIGVGGFGAVYRAYQSVVGREVAIKIILPMLASQPEFIRRFEAEAQLVARLEHPYIVPLYDYWRDPGGAFLVMRYIRGGNLHQALQTGPLALEATARLLDQIGAALTAAHRQGVIHRDLKPANILLDEEHNAFLADFGIAKDLRKTSPADQTAPGGLVGSPSYISPEQIKEEPVSPQTDIYNLGLIIYELLTGSKPFPGATPTDLLFRQLHEPLPSLADRRPDLPPDLNAVIQRATAKPPAARYPDVATLVGAFQAAARQPVTTRAPVTPVLGAPAPGRRATEHEIALPTPQNPYKGLRAFQQADAADFFGRTALTARLVARLGEQTPLARCLAVVGPSGSGKSSVVSAGLVPALRQGALPGAERWFVVEMQPGPQPLEELEAALLRVAVNPPESLLHQLAEDERGLVRAVKRVLPAEPSIELLLIVDQFEEVFTLVEDEAVRARFLAGISAAVRDPRSRLRVVLTLRADFYDRPLLYPALGELVRQRTEVVLPLTAEELEQAIVRPALRVGVTPEPELIACIVQDVGAQPGALPLVQYALTEVFERREDRIMRLDAYRASGGVGGALARRAEETYAGLDPAAQALARQVFLRLVTLGEGSEDTRRRVQLAELRALGPDEWSVVSGQWSVVSGQWSAETATDTANPKSKIQNPKSPTPLDAVLDTFGRYRLLTFDRDPISRGPTVEVAHEALIRTWSRLREWLAAAREDLRVQRRLTTAVTEWAQAGRDPSFLAGGARLAQFAALADPAEGAPALALTANERAYLAAGLAAEHAQQAAETVQREQALDLARQAAAAAQTAAAAAEQAARADRTAATRLRALAGVLGVFLLAAVALTAVVLNLRQVAETQREAATRQVRVARAQALAAQALSQLDPDPDLSLLLAMEAVSATRRLGEPVVPQAEDALRQVILRSPLLRTLQGHAGSVNGAAWSPDGARVATVGDDGTTRVWDRATGQQLRMLYGHQGPVQAVAWSPDGARLATAGSDGVLHLWDAATGQDRSGKHAHPGGVLTVAYSPDGSRLITGGADSLARVWDTRTGQTVLTLTHPLGVRRAAFSPDGHTIATATDYGTVYLWDAATGRPGPILAGHSGSVFGLSWSADGRTILTAGADGTVRLWDATTGQQQGEPLFHDRNWPATGAVFSADGARIVTTSWSGKTTLWDTRTRGEVGTLYGHIDQVLSVAYSPDGAYFITTSRDATAKIWQTAMGQEGATLRGHTGNVWTAAYSPDGRQIVTASDDQTARIWDAATGQEIRALRGHIAPLADAAWSPDGTRIVTAGRDNMAKVWDAASGADLATLRGHTVGVLSAAFSPDGRQIVTASVDGTARIWDAATYQEVRRLTGHTGDVTSAAWSPDGRWIVTGGVDGTARVWDAASGQPRFTLQGHTAQVYQALFSPDGRWVLTAGWDATARVWDATTGEARTTLTGHRRGVRTAAYSPDGRWIVTASADETARIWDAGAGAVPGASIPSRTTLEGHTDRVWDAAWSPDGRWVVTASSDGTARQYLTSADALLALAATRAGRTLTPAERATYLGAPFAASTPAVSPVPSPSP